jgi:hypothetical protein
VFVLATLLVGLQLLAAADSVPVFDVKKSCQGVEYEAALFEAYHSLKQGEKRTTKL